MFVISQNVAMVAWAPLVVALWTFVGISIVPIITRIFVALGVGFVTFTGFSLLFDQAESMITDSFNGMPANMLAMMQLARVDDAAGLVLSAISIKITWKLFQGSLKVMRFT